MQGEISIKLLIERLKQKALETIPDIKDPARYEEYNFHSVLSYRGDRIIGILNNYTDYRDFSTSKILDAGCGCGGITIYISVKCLFPYILAFDLDYHRIRPLKDTIEDEKMENIDVLEADINSLPFRGEKIDFILCEGVLHFSKDYLQTCKVFYHLLSQNGVLMILGKNKLCPLDIIAQIPGICYFPNRRIKRYAKTYSEVRKAKGFGFASVFGLIRNMKRVGFRNVKPFNPRTKSAKGLLRYFLPTMVVVGSK